VKKIKIPTTYDFENNSEVAIDKNDFDKLRSDICRHNKLIEGAVEVSGSSRSVSEDLWTMSETVVGKALPHHTHRAYLIGIKPIKKETAEDVLKGVMESGSLTHELFDRAKAVLGDSE